ncbi:MAG: Mrr restriction system protein [Candidatus Eremiobacteraeota bacterium]|nr:Mrr restriction system protein [Candidatus Eremiobacteraeota bacterium]
MAEITTQRLGMLLRGVLTILRECPDGLQAADVIRRVEQVVPPTEFEKSTYPKRPKDRRFDKTLRFSTIGAVKAGWIIKSNGVWTITPEGKQAFETYPNPEALFSRVNQLYREWAGSREPASVEIEQAPADVSTTYEEAVETAVSEIREHLAKMQPYRFQDLVAALLRAIGYYVTWIAPPGADGGVDLIAHGDALGTTTPRIKVQVKRQQSPIAVDQMRSFIGLIGDKDVGIFVSPGGFTRDAEAEARRHFAKLISMIGFDDLFRLWDNTTGN